MSTLPRMDIDMHATRSASKLAGVVDPCDSPGDLNLAPPAVYIEISHITAGSCLSKEDRNFQEPRIASLHQWQPNTISASARFRCALLTKLQNIRQIPLIPNRPTLPGVSENS